MDSHHTAFFPSPFYGYMPYNMWFDLMDSGSPAVSPTSPFYPVNSSAAMLMLAQQAMNCSQDSTCAVPTKMAKFDNGIKLEIESVNTQNKVQEHETKDGAVIQRRDGRPRRKIRTSCVTSPTPVGEETSDNMSKKRPSAFIDGETSCPICGVVLRSIELKEHYQYELETFGKLLKSDESIAITQFPAQHSIVPSSSKSRKSKSWTKESRKNVLTRVQQNRQTRVSAGSTSSSTPCSPSTPDPSPTTSGSSSQATSCPVCNQILTGSTVSMNEHVDNCLNKQSTHTSSGSECEDDDLDSYTWCGQTRVRATSLLGHDALSASGFSTVKSCLAEESDQYLVVDDDDREVYGQAQYSEADVIPCNSDEPKEAKEQQALRGAVLSTSQCSTTKSPLTADCSKWTDSKETRTFSGSTHIDIPKCLICMDKYSEPLVSVQCWHVHCEECWLRTLGAKKLCPQCNMITSPKDLRRIYL